MRFLKGAAAGAAILALWAQAAGAQEDPLGALGAAFGAAAAKAGPAVVQVVCDREGDLPPGDNTRGQTEIPAPLVAKYQETLHLFARPEGPASGVVVDPDGYVLTSLYNLLGGLKAVRVVLPDGRALPARVLGRDPSKDVALLKVEATGLAALPVSADVRATPGQFALTLGRGASPSELTVNTGVVSALIRFRGDAIQTSARVNYGNSGGALVDLDGRLLGIIARVGHDPERSRSAGINSGVGFAAPAQGLAGVLEKLKRGENIPERPSAFLGIRFDPSYAEAKGARIEYVYKDYPGYRAGLKPGDVLLNFDHVDIEGRGDLMFVIQQCEPGQRVTYSIVRGEKDMDLESVLSPRPPESENARMTREYMEWKAPRALGLRVDYAYDGPGTSVALVHEGFPLRRAGLQPGEVLVSVFGLRELPGWFPIADLLYFDRTLQYCWEGAALTFVAFGKDGVRMVPILSGRLAGDADVPALDRAWEAARAAAPKPPAGAERQALLQEVARWQLRVLLGIKVGALTEAGFEIDFVHRGFPGAACGLSKGDVLTSVNGVAARELPDRIRTLFAPPQQRILWLPEDKWILEVRQGGAAKKVTATLTAAPEPAVVRAMDEEAGGPWKALPSDAARLTALLRDWNASGRLQALRALTREGLWKPSLDLVLVELLGDRDRAFTEAVAESLRARPSKATLEALILSLPVDGVAPDRRRAEQAKVDILRAWLDRSEWPGKAPEIDPDGVKWQRWWRENKDRVKWK
ncbi:MAG: trypsin-like peptidase domain-containing protein [Planctomycetes bacterium]|nr:trypsin-like peptidase domain-containing protein [Planctomycetota bacterium]